MSAAAFGMIFLLFLIIFKLYSHWIGFASGEFSNIVWDLDIET